VETAMKLEVPYNLVNFLISWPIISFSRTYQWSLFST